MLHFILFANFAHLQSFCVKIRKKKEKIGTTPLANIRKLSNTANFLIPWLWSITHVKHAMPLPCVNTTIQHTSKTTVQKRRPCRDIATNQYCVRASQWNRQVHTVWRFAMYQQTDEIGRLTVRWNLMIL